MAENSDRTDRELEKMMERKIEEKKEELKKEAKQEARKELRKEIIENVQKETDNTDMSRRQFLKKAGLGAAGLGALGLAPAASQLKLTKNGIFGSTGQSQEMKDVETLKADKISTDTATINQVAVVISNNSISTSLADNADVKLEWDNIEKEDSNIFTVDLSNNEITLDVGGDYMVQVTGMVNADSGWSTGDRLRPFIRVNGSTEIDYAQIRKVGTDKQSFRAFGYLDNLSAGDTITGAFRQKSGNTKQINPNSFANRLMVRRVG